MIVRGLILVALGVLVLWNVFSGRPVLPNTRSSNCSSAKREAERPSFLAVAS